ncbi:hypothetical protein KSP39_PZI014590 [Platanthera zijinensis]|uniref:Uncharacterized protein n=1 Tax=Platanthera zijinensis TaxID=2320716 RepID=A0AAP0G2R3_9ASPA
MEGRRVGDPAGRRRGGRRAGRGGERCSSTRVDVGFYGQNAGRSEAEDNLGTKIGFKQTAEPRRIRIPSRALICILHS